jgi:hypothetical protein
MRKPGPRRGGIADRAVSGASGLTTGRRPLHAPRHPINTSCRPLHVPKPHRACRSGPECRSGPSGSGWSRRSASPGLRSPSASRTAPAGMPYAPELGFSAVTLQPLSRSQSGSKAWIDNVTKVNLGIGRVYCDLLSPLTPQCALGRRGVGTRTYAGAGDRACSGSADLASGVLSVGIDAMENRLRQWHSGASAQHDASPGRQPMPPEGGTH